MHRTRLGGKELRCFDQFVGGLGFTFRVNDLSPAFALCLCLFGDRANHTFIDVDVFDFNIGDFDSPLVGLLVEDALNVTIKTLSLG